MYSKFPLILLLFIISQQAFGWGELGHGTSGYVAEQFLTPKGKGFVYSILGPEPLAVSSNWSDGVRSDDRYANFTNYHYFDIPAGQTAELVKLENGGGQDATTIIDQVPQLLLGNKISQQQKIVLFRYLIHVIEDVHQPLHVGNAVDRGANLCDVRLSASSPNIKNLHSIWDETLVSETGDLYRKQNPSLKFFGYREFGSALIAEQASLGIDAKAAQAVSSSTWYNESRKLHADVYPGGEVSDPSTRVYCRVADSTGAVVNGKYDPNQLPLIDDAYRAKAYTIIKKQLLLGGIRLAGVINAIAEKSKAPKWTEALDKSFFSPLQLNNSSGRKPQSTKKSLTPGLQKRSGQE